MLGFFCVLGPRNLFETVGLLDEAFGVGYYEDDDYCLRCIQSGFKLKIAREVFLHHWGSASFSSVGSQKINLLFEKNRKIFEQKHKKKWIPHRDRWATSLSLEMDWMRQGDSKSLDFKAIDQIAEKWVRMVRNESFGLCSLPTYVPGNRSFLGYVREGLLIRLNTLKLPLPGFLVSVLKFLVEYFVRPPRETVGLVRMRFRRFLKNCYGILNFFSHRMKATRLKQEFCSQNNTIVIAPIQGYFGRRQRPQHIADSLARSRNNVFWLEPKISNASVAHEVKSLNVQRLNNDIKNLYSVYNTGFSFENFYVSAWSESQAKEYLTTLAASLLRFGVKLEDTTLIIQSPFWAKLAKFYPGSVVYECMDAHDSFGSATAEVLMLEHQLIEYSDSIVVSSSYLYEKIRLKAGNRQIFLVRNGCELESFKMESQLISDQSGSKVTVGYFGAVAEWFDCELVAETAKLLPHVEFEIIGDLSRSNADLMRPVKNIKLFGEKKYVELSGLAAHWKAALIPFKLNELIFATNPVKLYEYSALGLPVVATSIPEVKIAQIKTYIGDTPQDFAAGILQAIQDNSDDIRKMRREFAQNNSWLQRVPTVVNAVEAAKDRAGLKSPSQETSLSDQAEAVALQPV
jgi:glycosyltransferase involved in cell wall biosynthesis